jgi:hypothetical protein
VIPKDQCHQPNNRLNFWCYISLNNPLHGPGPWTSVKMGNNLAWCLKWMPLVSTGWKPRPQCHRDCEPPYLRSQLLLRTGSCHPDQALKFPSLVSMEYIQWFAHQTYKERATISESCETVDPGLITQILLLLLQLQVYSMRVFPAILRERVWDDVCWVEVQRTNGDVVLFDFVLDCFSAPPFNLTWWLGERTRSGPYSRNPFRMSLPT